jgi:hypothetical protein
LNSIEDENKKFDRLVELNVQEQVFVILFLSNLSMFLINLKNLS